jgi:hypothetical protein
MSHLDRTISFVHPSGAGSNPTILPDYLVRGHLLKVASLRDEWFQPLDEPRAFVEAARRSPRRVDLVTFIQRLPDVEPRHNYCTEWDNVAAIRISDYEHWWNEQIPKSTRKHIRRAEKAGIVARPVPFSDDLVRGIQDIYNETPFRQGRRFSHYGKDFETLKRAHGTFAGNREFIGAYLNGEFIGFVSLIYTGQTARSVQVITKVRHHDKWPTNVLLAKAVEVCATRGIPYLVYGKYDYGKIGTPGLMSFKEENGFRKTLFPRYFIPLTAWGKIALSMKLHHGWVEFLPAALVRSLMQLRSRYYHLRYARRRRDSGC